MTMDDKIRYAIKKKYLKIDINKGKVYLTRRGGMEACSNSTAGYLRAHISIKGKHAHFRLHRVIWIAKYGSIPEGTVVCHKNNKKKDNRISNLYAATQKQNTQDAIRDGLFKVPRINRKFSPDIIEEIKKDYAKTNHAVKFLMNKYGISKTHLYRFVTMI